MSSRSLRSLIDFFFFLNVTKLSKKKYQVAYVHPKGIKLSCSSNFFFFFLLYPLPRPPHEEFFNLASPLFILALTFA